MAEANARIARVDAWLIPGLGRTIAITNANGTDWPADTYAHFGPLSESTGEVVPTIAAVTATVVGPVATVTLTEADVETIREAFPHTGFARCPWHIRTGSGAGEVAHATGFLGWDLTGSAQSATAVATVIVGPVGPANVLSIGTVTTGAAGSNAAASLSGASPAQSLGLTIPRGDKGETGTTGQQGPRGYDGPPGDVTGAGLARFIERARAGENLTITCLGDSILEGQTVTNPATDGAMILLAADLSTRYGVTVTQTNHASSGYTALRAHTNGNVAAALAEKADLYIVSAFDKNDIGSDIYGQYAAGYPLAQSCGAIERIIRGIRTSVPKADIIVMSTNPYTAGSSSNPYQLAKGQAVRRVAAVYGCEWVDVYGAWIDLGDYSSYSGDGTHPNTAGHRLIANILLTHLVDQSRATHQPGAVATLGVYSPENVAANTNLGYAVNAVPGAVSDVSYVAGGTGWVSEVTSTAGDYIETVAYCTELAIQISTAAADNCVADIAVDGVTVRTGLNLSTTGGKQGTYWVPFAMGLTPGSHTLRLTLVSGTLRTSATAALLAPVAAAYVTHTATAAISGTIAATTLTTSYQILSTAAIPLPAGWGGMDVMLSGYLSPRCVGATSAMRRVDVSMWAASSLIGIARQMNVPVAAATTIFPQIPLSGSRRGVSSTVTIELGAKVDDATNTVQAVGWALDALLVRTS